MATLSRRMLVTTLALIAPVLAHAADPAPTPRTLPTAVAETRAALRDLWSGHVFWVRNVVEARLAGDADRAKVAEQQVVANAHDIAGAIEPFYGKAASDQLFTLLAGHYGAVSEYLDATRQHQAAAQQSAVAHLTENSGQIATFLHSANPKNWPVDTLRGLLNAHGAHHVQQINELAAHRYAQEAQTWGAMTHHMNMIADALADGLAAQFPDRFR